MTQIEQILQKLKIVIEKMNLWETNAKTIAELPEQLTLNPISKLHVATNGDSESLEIQTLIDAITSNNFAQLLNIGDITIVGNTVTVPAGAVWKIGTTTYNTPSATIINVPLAAAGKSRIDILVANTSGQIIKITGVETSAIFVRPNIPLNTVLVTEININDTSVTNISIPITYSDYVNKYEKFRILNSEAGNIDIDFPDERAIMYLTGSVTNIRSANTSNLYLGKKFAIKNEQTTDVTIEHLSVSGDGNTLFRFPNSENFILKPNEIIEFLFDKSDGYYLNFVGVTSSTIPIDTTVIENSPNAVSGGAVFDELATKSDELATKRDDSTPRTGSIIHFFTPQIYNSVASPTASNITNDLTDAKIGIVQKIYSNKAVEPTFPAGWIKLGSGNYTPSVLNVIFAEWVSGTRVEYWIVKPN